LASSRILKKPAGVVLGSSKSSMYRMRFSEAEVLEGLFRSPRFIEGANGPTKCGGYLLRFRFARGLAWDKARPWAKRLSWQTQGGRVT
jgi:hypothetical protein